MNHRLAWLCSPFISLCLTVPDPAIAAEHLRLQVGPWQQTVAIESLETFVETGEVPPEMEPVAWALTPQLRYILGQRLALEPNIAQEFLDELLTTRDGQRLLSEVNEALPGSTPKQLEATLYRLIHEPDGLSPLNLLKAYPNKTLTVDLPNVGKIALHVHRPHLQSQIIWPAIAHLLAPQHTRPRVAPGFDPRQPGPQAVTQRTLNLYDATRDRQIPVDLYYGEEPQGPMVVLSHGFAADRQFLAYLAEHLASYGFSVATLEHPGSNVNVLAQVALTQEPTEVLSATEFVDRPRDVQFLLNELERRQRPWSIPLRKFNTQAVIHIGHSLGGYTGLALAGAKLDLRRLRQFCQARSPVGRAPADWLQCAAAALPYRQLEFRDKRIIRVIAMNPIVGQLFGENGLKAAAVPVTILSHSDDVITPTLENQLLPYQTLPQAEQLIVIGGATHMSITDTNNENSPVAQNSFVRERMGT
jgi:predicted dienelactone hydrolase